MNKYVKEFFHRGLMFSGFGPIVAGIVYYIVSFTDSNFQLTGKQVLIAIISTYFLAFIQAGVSVFNQIEHWSLPKSLLFHFLSLYIAYVSCYLVNTWIPFDITVILIFTAIFVVIYFVIWFTVYFIVKSTSENLNKKLN
ncbi:MAG: DUF3021 domain-containing protein [Ruminococcaceae bacterium]|nr:DUF3021 domain-containing protein [Oscillospiraceae bacterium]